MKQIKELVGTFDTWVQEKPLICTDINKKNIIFISELTKLQN